MIGVHKLYDSQGADGFGAGAGGRQGGNLWLRIGIRDKVKVIKEVMASVIG